MSASIDDVRQGVAWAPGAAAVALASCLAGGWIALHHPLSPVLALAGFMLWIAVTLHWPRAWQWMLPALLPALGLAPWSGWIGVDEFDLAVLATCAGGYAIRARFAGARDGATDPAYDRVFAVALAVAGAVWTIVGLSHAEVLRLSWFDGYDSALNTLRVAKGSFAALILLPLVRRDPAVRCVGDTDSGSVLACGMVAGAMLVGLAAIWERLAFTGLWNTSIYYRTTALFWEMHVGGSAIEAYLVLSVPFVAACLVRARTPWGRAVALCVAAAVAYTGLSTLSRSLYGALMVSALTALWLMSRSDGDQALGGGLRPSARLALAVAAVWALSAAAQWLVRESGYGSAFLVAASVWLAAALPMRQSLRSYAARDRDIGALAVVLVLVVELGAVLEGVSFLNLRLHSAADDLASRIAHWQRASRQLSGPLDWILGRGLGRFPVDYPARVPTVEVPGSFSVVANGGHRFARLVGPPTRAAMAGVFGMAQRVGPLAAGRYTASFDARTALDRDVTLSLCEKHLIYEADCAFATVRVASGGWRAHTVELDASDLEGGPWYAPRPVLFAVASADIGAAVDIDNLRLRGEDGRDLLANGDFSADAARWFLAGRYFFITWHADSLALELLVERGLLGLALFALLAARALLRWAGPAGRADLLAPYHAAALAGCLFLGLFSSVLDVPRNAFLLTMLMLLKPVPTAARPHASAVARSV